MRILSVVLSVLLAASAHAQESYGTIGGGLASDGPSVRLAGGLKRGPVTPSVRLTVGGGEVDHPNPSRDAPYTRGRVEFGVGIARVQPVAGPFLVEGQVGVAYALAAGDEEEETQPFFDFPDLAFGLVAPVEATALVRLGSRLDFGLTVSRSFTIAHASSEDDPNLRASVPSLQQTALTLGLRFH